jgi:hypothetical protein
VRRRRLAVIGLAALACAGAAQATASETATPDATPPPSTFRLPGMTLRIEPTQITVGTGSEVRFSATLTRKLDAGTLELTLPQAWLAPSPADGKPQAKTPLHGGASTGRIRTLRTGRVVRLIFTKGRRGDVARYAVIDRSLPAATYRPRFALRVGGRVEATATGSVVVLALPVRVPEP